MLNAAGRMPGPGPCSMSAASTPKIKLTLKLNSSTSLVSSASSSPPATPVKATTTTTTTTAATATATDAKRPKKGKPSITEPRTHTPTPTPTPTPAPNLTPTAEFDLGAFVRRQGELRCRAWVLQRAVRLHSVLPYRAAVALDAPLWVTHGAPHASPAPPCALVNLLVDHGAQAAADAPVAPGPAPDAAFRCLECGKVFAERGKYKKHLPTHSEAAKEARRKARAAKKMRSATPPVPVDERPVAPATPASVSAPPVLRIRLKSASSSSVTSPDSKQ